MDDRLKQIQKLLDAAEGNLHSARNLLRELVGSGSAPVLDAGEKAKDLNIIEEGKIIEGVYNGENMVGPDGKEYPVPPNYASKSKLVEGDVLKLTIAEDGSFIFKQINPIERKKALGTLVYEGGNYSVKAEGKNYKVLQASVTYYRGEPGDQVSVIIPRDHESAWAAVENIIKANGMGSDDPAPEETQPAAETQPKVEEVVQEVDSNTEESDGPAIEFPPPKLDNAEPEVPAEAEEPQASTQETPGISEEDQKILDSLSAQPAPEAPVEPVPQEEAPKAEDEDSGSQGIKELEI